jgi:hypothetical protein
MPRQATLPRYLWGMDYMKGGLFLRGCIATMKASFSPLLLVCLFVLTAFLEFISRVDTLAQLVVPCITWPILLVAGGIGIASGKGVRGELADTGERSESKIAICLLLANVC